MKITDYSFTNNDTEYNLIKELLLEVEIYPDMDNNWNPGRMDYWRYNRDYQDLLIGRPGMQPNTKVV